MLNPNFITRWFVLLTVPALLLANGANAAAPSGYDWLASISETQSDLAVIEARMTELKRHATAIFDEASEHKKLYEETGKREHLVAYTEAMARFDAVLAEYDAAAEKHRETAAMLDEQVQKVKGEIDETQSIIEQLELSMNALMDRANVYLRQAEEYKNLYERTHLARYLAAYEAAYENYLETLNDHESVATQVKNLSIYAQDMVKGLTRLGL